jgi:hypothetical protein
MGRVLGHPVNSVWHAVNALEKAGLLSSKSVGARRVLSLSTNYRGAEEYRCFLSDISQATPIYGSRARAIPYITRRWR